eukprot:gene23415-58013_t
MGRGLTYATAALVAAPNSARAQYPGGDPFAGSGCTCDTFCAGSCAIFPLIVAGDNPNSTDLIIAFIVEVNGQWGPYLFCNPDDPKHPNAAWNCTTSPFSHHGWGPKPCDCPRVHQSVGRRNLTLSK